MIVVGKFLLQITFGLLNPRYGLDFNGMGRSGRFPDLLEVSKGCTCTLCTGDMHRSFLKLISVIVPNHLMHCIFFLCPFTFMCARACPRM